MLNICCIFAVHFNTKKDMTEIIINPEAIELTQHLYAYIQPYIREVLGFAVMFSIGIPVVKLNKKTLENNNKIT